MMVLVVNAWPDNPTDGFFSFNPSLRFLVPLNAATRTTEDQTESSEGGKKFRRIFRKQGQSFHPSGPVSAHPERSRILVISRRMSERGKRVTRIKLRVVQKSTIALPQIRRQLSLFSHHHPPCLPPPLPPSLLCISNLFTTHPRLRSHLVTTMARWVSAQRLSSRRGWPRSSTPPPPGSVCWNDGAHTLPNL